MNASKNPNSRRAFLAQGGAMLGAGVAATAGAATLAADATPSRADELRQLRRDLAAAQDREAIRHLQRALLSTPADPQSLSQPFHRAYRPDTRKPDTLTLADNGHQATGALYVSAEVCTPLQGDSTIATMARLQGNVADSRWEAGRLDVTYLKTTGVWRIATLAYTRLPTQAGSQHG